MVASWLARAACVLLAAVAMVAADFESSSAFGGRPSRRYPNYPLSYGFYRYKCPQVELVVRRVSEQYISGDETLAPSLLRMHFHDCFVNGCDGSILLNSKSPKTNPAEKDSFVNLSLRGYNVIDAAKDILEVQCPGIVSCADILALVARDSVNLLGGPYYAVALGRRDGSISRAADVLTNLPAPFFNFAQLKASFQRKGLSVKDLVVLSGGHTVGSSACSNVATRLYNFTGKGDADPSLDATYAEQLRTVCKPNDTVTRIPMDRGSQLTFDAHYFSEVQHNRGLFTSDAALLTDAQALAILRSETRGGTGRAFPFFAQFPDSMRSMGKISVLTGRQGKIRKVCSIA